MSIRVYGGDPSSSAARATTAKAVSNSGPRAAAEESPDVRRRRQQLLAESGIDMTMEGYRDQIDHQMHKGGVSEPGAGSAYPATGKSSNEMKGWGASTSQKPEGGQRHAATERNGNGDRGGPLCTAAFGAPSAGKGAAAPVSRNAVLGEAATGSRAQPTPSLLANDMEFETRRAVQRTAAPPAAREVQRTAAPPAAREAEQVPDDMEFETRRAVPRVAAPASSPAQDDLEFETRRAVPRVAAPPPKPSLSYAVGDTAWVFSNSQGKWLRAQVTNLEAGVVTVKYRLLDGGEAQKQLLAEDSALKPASFKPP